MPWLKTHIAEARCGVGGLWVGAVEQRPRGVGCCRPGQNTGVSPLRQTMKPFGSG